MASEHNIYDAIDPLDSRYFDAETSKYLSEKSRIAYQARVETALAQTLADFNICSRKIANEIVAAAAEITPEEVYQEEKTTKHDIKALVNVIKMKTSDEAKPYVHFGATSYDIIATANALQMKDAVQELLEPRIVALLDLLIGQADKYAETVQVGRTHGQHAVPVSYGFTLSEYVSRLGTSLLAMSDLSDSLNGKFSGATGSYNALSVFVDDPLSFEKKVMERLGLEAAPYSTQIVPPEQFIRLLDEMSITAGIMANLAHDMRHLQRTEIAEVREKFEAGQTGSSTMAHKRNPWNFENVVSLSKQVFSQTVNASLNISSEHQRDLTDSASSRFYVLVPALLANMASRLGRVMGKLEVDEANMKRNLEMSAGAIAAEPLYLLFEKYGHTAAHEKTKALAHQALESGKSLQLVVENDSEAKKYWRKLTKLERQIIANPEIHYTGLAAAKTRRITSEWKKKISQIK